MEKRHSILFLLWLSFVLADFLYVWVANFKLTHEHDAVEPAPSSMVRAGLWILAVADIWVLHGFWKKRFLLKDAILTLPAKAIIPAALRDHASPLEEQAARVVSLYFTFKLGAFALGAAIVIYGFVLAFVGHDVTDQYFLSLVSLALLLYEFSSKSFFQDLARTVEIRGDQTQPVVKG